MYLTAIEWPGSTKTDVKLSSIVRSLNHSFVSSYIPEFIYSLITLALDIEALKFWVAVQMRVCIAYIGEYMCEICRKRTETCVPDIFSYAGLSIVHRSNSTRSRLKSGYDNYLTVFGRFPQQERTAGIQQNETDRRLRLIA